MDKRFGILGVDDEPATDHPSCNTLLSSFPEVGEHPVQLEPKISQTAERAANRCIEVSSYYERSYGERGCHFTDSDIARLAFFIKI